jgi:hypothetical protein
MSTEYLRLNDSRPELMGGLTGFDSVNTVPDKSIKRISINENKFMNMTISQIFDKIVNILPNMYNDYYNKHLESSINLKNSGENITESDIFRKTMKSFIFENENIIYLGILILIITFFLYIIN